MEKKKNFLVVVWDSRYNRYQITPIYAPSVHDIVTYAFIKAGGNPMAQGLKSSFADIKPAEMERLRDSGLSYWESKIGDGWKINLLKVPTPTSFYVFTLTGDV